VDVQLTIREHESLARVEHSPDHLETTVVLSNLEDLGQGHQQSGSTAGLEDQLVGVDKERRLAQQEGIHTVVLNGVQDLALDNGQHLVPDRLGDDAETVAVGASESVILRDFLDILVGDGADALEEVRGWSEPDLQELLGSFERSGFLGVVGGIQEGIVAEASLVVVKVDRSHSSSSIGGRDEVVGEGGVVGIIKVVKSSLELARGSLGGVGRDRNSHSRGGFLSGRLGKRIRVAFSEDARTRRALEVAFLTK